jgi:hypothetical protein
LWFTVQQITGAMVMIYLKIIQESGNGPPKEPVHAKAPEKIETVVWGISSLWSLPNRQYSTLA